MKTLTCQACGIENDAAETCPVCGVKFIDRSEADRLTNELTAFRTFAEFCTAMTGESGQRYVPTIYTTGVKRLSGLVKRKRLVNMVRVRGFKVYDGGKVA